ncbi:helix-turn-helix transcriptional regulator [Paraburkholderia sp. SIMBA_053]|uniref:helix-turn-helix transcriptional regulator n=1 Tax=Paraburkholderia sp. SIMBA_053 TaxID=3085794 RepID=UPI00397A315A
MSEKAVYEMPLAGFVREKDLITVLAISRKTLERWCTAGRFPAAVRLGEKAKGWNVDVVRAWIDARSNGSAI